MAEHPAAAIFQENRHDSGRVTLSTAASTVAISPDRNRKTRM